MVEQQRDDIWTNLLARIEAGEWADLSPDATGARPAISARLLCDLLLGRPVRTSSGSRSIPLPATGVRLRGATIMGPMELDDAALPDGGPLPAIILAECVFSDAIRLSRARLRHLSLAGSKIVHLSANDAVIDGPLDLSGVSSSQQDGAGNGAEKRGLCWAELRGAQIAGSVLAVGARFVAPPRRKDYDPVFMQARFALDLWNARVAGSLTLTPGLYAMGGVSLQLARIDGEAWCDGAELIALEGNALNADEARLEGSLYGRAAMPTGQVSTRFRATGGVSLYHARIAGSLNLEGASLSCGDRDAYYAFDARGASIQGVVNFSALTPISQEDKRGETERLQTTGGASFASAIIAGDFFAGGAALNAASQIVALDLSGARIGGNANFDVHPGHTAGASAAFPFEAKGTLNLSGADIGGSLTMLGAVLAARDAANAGAELERSLLADSVRIGLHVQLGAISAMVGDRSRTFRFSSAGQVNLFRAQIGGILILDGASLRASGEAALFAESARLAQVVAGVFVGEDDGAKRVHRFEATGGVSFQNARIAQSVFFTGAQLDQGNAGFALDMQKVEIGGTVFLTADVRTLDADGQPLVFNVTGLTNLSSAHIGGDLNALGAKFSAPKRTAVLANNLRVGGNASLSLLVQDIDSAPVWLRFVAEGFVDFTDAEIAGFLSLTGASLKAQEAPWAFSASGATIGELRLDSTEIFWDRAFRTFRFEAFGGVFLDRLKVARRLALAGAYLEGPTAIGAINDPALPPARGWSLRAERLEIGGEAMLGSIGITEDGVRKILPVDSLGPVSLAHSRIAGDLTVQMRGSGRWTFDQAQVGGRTSIRNDFTDEISFRGANLGATLNVRRMSLDGRGAKPADWPDGRRAKGPLVDLGDAQAVMLDDDGGGAWGPDARLDLEGFKFQKVAEPRPEARRRLGWLRRQIHQKERDRNQLLAYKQLADILDSGGHAETARRISFARKGLEQRVTGLGPGKVLQVLHGAMFGYGIFPERFAIWLILYWFCVMLAVQVASTGRLEASIPGGLFSPPGIVLREPDAPPVFVLPARAGVPEQPCEPSVHAGLYALDIILGPLDLGQEKRCVVTERPDAVVWRGAFQAIATLGLIASIVAPLLLPFIIGVFARRFST